MNPNKSMLSLLSSLWCHISPRRRAQFLLLFLLIMLASFAEIISIGAIMPFLGVLTAPQHIFEMSAMQPIIQNFGLSEPKQLVLPLTIAFGAAALLSGVIRLVLLWASTRLSFAVGADLSNSIYRRTLYQKYSKHCARNSSEIIDGISGKAIGVTFYIIIPFLTLISSSIILLSILIALILVEPLITLVAFIGFGSIYLVIILLTRKKLMTYSKSIAYESTQVIKSLQEGLGGIRDILIGGFQEVYCNIYRNANSSLLRAQGNSFFISASPRYCIEVFGMILIAVIAYYLSQQVDDINNTISILGSLAFGAQRLLPLLQQSYASWTQINIGKASLEDTLRLLDQPLPDYANEVEKRLPFNKHIILRGLGFRYSDETPSALSQIDLTIPKGARIGFIGKSGSGKSTLLDIVMGLLEPTNGSIEVDGRPITPANHRAWQMHIAHVPQTIFLADSTIEENIAFGIPRDQIDHYRVKKAAEQAQIAANIESWPMKYKTIVGERGTRISGGQRQRIGIARALYKQADVIIFDEATSALDGETEEAVMHAIDNLSKELTLLIVAHRHTTLKSCNQVVELSNGNIIRIGTYQQII